MPIEGTDVDFRVSADGNGITFSATPRDGEDEDEPLPPRGRDPNAAGPPPPPADEEEEGPEGGQGF